MAANKAKNRQNTKPVYVIAGKDNFLTATRCRELLDQLLTPEQRPMALYQPEQSDKADITEILDELRTLPFLADVRVVLIKDADKFVSNHRELLEKYFDRPSPTGVLVLAVQTWPKNTRLAKKLAKIGELFNVSELKPWQLPAYAVDYARKQYDKGLSKTTAGFLVELVGDDAGRLTREVDKLAMYAADQKTITAQHVESLIGHNRMFNAFAVIDAVTAGNVGAAVDRLRNMFATDKNADFTTVGAFAYHFRKMFNAKVMLDEGNAVNYIAGKLRIWYNKDAFFAQLGKTSLNTIADVLQQLARIDYQIKTGRSSPKVALEKLVLDLANN